MSKTDNMPTPGSSPLYTPRELRAKKRDLINTRGTDLDGAYRYNGRKREAVEAAEASADAA
jgi:hypothetical protein